LKKVFIGCFLAVGAQLGAQNLPGSFNDAYRIFTSDKFFDHASISLLVVNDATGKTVTNSNSAMGLAPASCQKVITACTSFELLGHDYTYKTTLGYTGTITNGVLHGDVVIKGSGDPTLGSWRYTSTSEETIIAAFKAAILRAGISEIKGHVYADENLWKGGVTPDGWIWEDIGNYYGAGAQALNWRENQYDLILRSGERVGDTVNFVGTSPAYVSGLHLAIMATAAGKETGDNAYIYPPQGSPYTSVRGTIPVAEDSFTISGSMPHPALQLAITLESVLKNLPLKDIALQYPDKNPKFDSVTIFYTHTSPDLDSIVFWFLKKSVNLYGEALIKTLASKFTNVGAADSGVSIIKSFWQKKGIDPASLNVIDGSGLSPANRITTASLVHVLQFAKKQEWFSSFYAALPEINGIKMKSGSIGGVVSYAGYVRGKNGTNYTFAFIINNFDGNASEVRKKMWGLLDLLK